MAIIDLEAPFKVLDIERLIPTTGGLITLYEATSNIPAITSEFIGNAKTVPLQALALSGHELRILGYTFQVMGTGIQNGINLALLKKQADQSYHLLLLLINEKLGEAKQYAGRMVIALFDLAGETKDDIKNATYAAVLAAAGFYNDVKRAVTSEPFERLTETGELLAIAILLWIVTSWFK